jgi:hypothetical protein
MTQADEYRLKAGELIAQAGRETRLNVRRECLGLAQRYLRLAEQAELNSQTDLVYETPPHRESAEPAQQQQQQQQQQPQSSSRQKS